MFFIFILQHLFIWRLGSVLFIYLLFVDFFVGLENLGFFFLSNLIYILLIVFFFFYFSKFLKLKFFHDFFLNVKLIGN